ncbi:PAS domain S-box protein [Pedobacter sp. HX-22-1]|uniref:histidine kinase n=2 Tax=Pedobacter puniceum TaxID=2666136 RepID=A0A7K0FRC9_9SPHI|nr:PAS domain S-box protein [Pedobacter puniceum]
MIVLFMSIRESYLLFHTLVELFSVTVAFAVFIVTWNSRKILDNNYLFLVGIAYLFIGILDILHALTYKGMNIIKSTTFYANQFWIATRFLESITLLVGFWFLKRKHRLNADYIFIIYLLISSLLISSILYWKNFPICYVEGIGQTAFKIYAEYIIIFILISACYTLVKRQNYFDSKVFKLLFASLSFSILSEFCFTLYLTNDGVFNQIGHYGKLISFFLIYKANVETSFLNPTGILFKGLKDKEESYRTLAENLPELIIRLDKNFRCIYTNSALSKFTNLNSQHFLGKALFAMGLPDYFEQALMEILLSAQRDKSLKETKLDIVLDSKTYFFAIQIVPEYISDNEIETYLIICYDITQLKNTENHLQELNATKDKFFSIIAHDLKNPFNALIGFSELIYKNTEKYSTERIQQLGLRMYTSAKQAFNLLENLLSWSRIQTGNLVPKIQTLHAVDLLTETHQLFLAAADAKNISINLNYREFIYVNADRQMLNTVLRNLITNAIKFTHPNGKIELKLETKNQEVLFSISDNGIGIEKGYLDEIFKIENRYSKPGTADEKGTGLGLILAKEFIELHNGKIWVESEINKGTTFYFTLPSPLT